MDDTSMTLYRMLGLGFKTIGEMVTTVYKHVVYFPYMRLTRCDQLPMIVNNDSRTRTGQPTYFYMKPYMIPFFNL